MIGMIKRYSMVLLWVSLLVIGSTNIHAFQYHYVEKDVREICKDVRCPDNEVCRVVRHCERPQCHPEFACLPCVPEGVDDECNSRNFTHSVLFGHPEKPRTLIPLTCNYGQTCPYGSTCAKHPNFVDLGNCCYGKTSAPVAKNDDKKCLLCLPECVKGFRCEKVTDECEESENVCMPIPKYGRCPEPKWKRWCRPRDRKRNCLHDQACPNQNKCCKNGCGGYDCRYPLRE